MWREITNIKVFGLYKIEDKMKELRKKIINEVIIDIVISLLSSLFFLLIMLIVELNVCFILFPFVIILLILFYLSTGLQEKISLFFKLNKDYKLLKGKINSVDVFIIPESDDECERIEMKVNGEYFFSFIEYLEYREDLEFSVLDVENEALLIAMSEDEFKGEMKK